MIIRLATIDDARDVGDIYRPAVASTPISFEVEPPTDAEMGRRIGDTLRTYPWLVCEHDGRVMGYAYAARHRDRLAYQWSVDAAVYVHAGARRSGVGRGLYTSLFAILDAQGYVNVYAGITLPNPGSVGLHESVGFRPVGVYEQVGYKMGAWHDVGWWQLALQSTRESPPRTLRPLADVMTDPAWPTMLAAGVAYVRESPARSSRPPTAR